MAEAEFRYSDLLPTGADDTPYRLDLVAQGALDPAVRLRVRLLVAGFGGELKAEYPGFSLGEMATICYVRIGRRPGKHTIERVLSTSDASGATDAVAGYVPLPYLGVSPFSGFAGLARVAP